MNCVAAPYPVREVSMVQLFRMHPRSPPRHLVAQVVQILRGGGIIIYPTDSCYALGWRIGDKGAQARIRLLRGVNQKHEFTWYAGTSPRSHCMPRSTTLPTA